MKRRAKKLTHAQLALRAVRTALTEARYSEQLETTARHERSYLVAIRLGLIEAENDFRRVVARQRSAR